MSLWSCGCCFTSCHRARKRIERRCTTFFVNKTRAWLPEPYDQTSIAVCFSRYESRAPSFHQTNMSANSFEEHEKRRKSSRQLGSDKKKKKFVEFMSMRLKYFVPKSIRSRKDVGIVTPVPVGRRIQN